MKNSTRKGLLWGLGFAALMQWIIWQYDNKHGEPFAIAWETWFVVPVICILLAKVFLRDSR